MSSSSLANQNNTGREVLSGADMDEFLSAFSHFMKSRLENKDYIEQISSSSDASIACFKHEESISVCSDRGSSRLEQELGPISPIQPYCMHKFDGQSSSTFVLASIGSLIRVVDDHIYIYDIFGTGNDNVIVKKWRDSNSQKNQIPIQQNLSSDRIVTAASVVLSSSDLVKVGTEEIQHVILFFTAMGKLLVYQLRRHGSSTLTLDMPNVIIQQRILGRNACQVRNDTLQLPSSSPKTCLFERKMVDNERFAAFSDLWGGDFRKRLFAVPSKSSFLRGCNMVDEVCITEMARNAMSRAQNQVASALGNVFSLGDSLRGANQASSISLGLQQGEYICKVVQHLPTRAVIVLTKKTQLPEIAHEESQSQLCQLFIKTVDENSASPHTEVNLSRLDLHEWSFFDSAWYLFCQARKEFRKATERVVCTMTGEAPSKRQKLVEGKEDCFKKEPEETTCSPAFWPPNRSSLTPIFPTLTSSCATSGIPAKSLGVSHIVDIDIDSVRDYLFVLSGNLVTIYEILNAGWREPTSKLWTDTESNESLRFRRVVSIDHRHKVESLHAQYDLTNSGDLISISAAAVEPMVPHRSDDVISLHPEANIEKLFTVRTKNAEYFYGFYIAMEGTISEFSTMPNLESFSIVLYKVYKLKQEMSVPFQDKDEKFDLAAPIAEPLLTTTSNVLSLNAVNESRLLPCATTCTMVPGEALSEDSTLPQESILESLASVNLFSSESRGALRHHCSFFGEVERLPYNLLLKDEEAYFGQIRLASPFSRAIKSYTPAEDNTIAEFHAYIAEIVHILENTQDLGQKKTSSSISELDHFNLKLLRLYILDDMLAMNSFQNNQVQNLPLETLYKVFSFQKKLYCASFLSASASVDVFQLDGYFRQGFSGDTKKEHPSKVNTPWTKDFTVHATDSTLSMPVPAFLRCVFSCLMDILGPLLHLRLFHFGVIGHTQGGISHVFNDEQFEAEALSTLASNEINGIQTKLRKFEVFVEGLANRSCEQEGISNGAKVRKISETFLYVYIPRLTSLTQVTRLDISTILSWVLRRLVMYVQRSIQILRFVQLIYANVRASYKVQLFDVNNSQSKTLLVLRLVNFWQIYWSALAQRQQSKESGKSAPWDGRRKIHASSSLYKMTFGSLFVGNVNEDMALSEHGYEASEFLCTFARSIFSFLSTATLLELEIYPGLGVTFKGSLRLVKQKAHDFASQLKSFNLLFTKAQLVELSILAKSKEIREAKLQLLFNPSDAMGNSVKQLENELRSLCADLAQSKSTNQNSDVMISVIYHFGIISRLNDRLAADSTCVSLLKYPMLNYYNLWVFVWMEQFKQNHKNSLSISTGENSSSTVLRCAEPLWHQMTERILFDISLHVGLPIQKLNKTNLDGGPTDGAVPSAVTIDDLCFHALVKTHFPVLDSKPSLQTRSFQLSDEIRHALSELFGVSGISHPSTLVFFKRMLKWAADDVMLAYLSQYDHNQAFFEIISQLKATVFSHIFHGIQKASAVNKQLLMNECEQFLQANQDSLCDVLVNFYQTFENFHPLRVDRQIHALLTGARRNPSVSGEQVAHFVQFIEKYSPTPLLTCALDQSYREKLAELTNESLMLSYRSSLLEKAKCIISDAQLPQGQVMHGNIGELCTITRIQLRLWELIHRILSGFTGTTTQGQLIARKTIRWNNVEYELKRFLLDVFYVLARISVFSEPCEYDSMSLMGITYNTPLVNSNFLGLLFLLSDALMGLDGELVLLRMLAEFDPFCDKLSKYDYWIRCRCEDRLAVNRLIASWTTSYLLGSTSLEDASAWHAEFINVVSRKGELLMHEFHRTKLFKQIAIHTILVLETHVKMHSECDETMVSTVPFRLCCRAENSPESHSRDKFPPQLIFACYVQLMQLKVKLPLMSLADDCILEGVCPWEKIDECQSLLPLCQKEKLLFGLISTLFIWYLQEIRDVYNMKTECITEKLKACHNLYEDFKEHAGDMCSKTMGAVEIILNRMDSMLTTYF
ncbi:hypothetical protein XU18_0051 [Perkinsela sp. CCAP 1560/4]|nr:hypothetical protein XU18_0051 [Perkinsela sp. CCAP 1560/4]|eukprot:KNH09366.1 hypothetical protein XU18_0051 [Perkinsela sp. CCAP 1560/4]